MHSTISTNLDDKTDLADGNYDTIDALPARVRAIATLRGLGYTYREIGRQFNVTPQAVSLMLIRHRRVLKKLVGAAELAQLSPRAVNALGRHGIRSREQARQAKVHKLLAGERNCGRKTLDEITRWMEQNGANAEAKKLLSVAEAA